MLPMEGFFKGSCSTVEICIRQVTIQSGFLPGLYPKWCGFYWFLPKCLCPCLTQSWLNFQNWLVWVRWLLIPLGPSNNFLIFWKESHSMQHSTHHPCQNRCQPGSINSLACCSPWDHKESDTTEPLNWTELIAAFTLENRGFGVIAWLFLPPSPL